VCVCVCVCVHVPITVCTIVAPRFRFVSFIPTTQFLVVTGYQQGRILWHLCWLFIFGVWCGSCGGCVSYGFCCIVICAILQLLGGVNVSIIRRDGLPLGGHDSSKGGGKEGEVRCTVPRMAHGKTPCCAEN